MNLLSPELATEVQRAVGSHPCRICVSVGSWQLIMAAAALTEHSKEKHEPELREVLVICAPLGSDALLQEQARVARALRAWHLVVFLNAEKIAPWRSFAAAAGTVAAAFRETRVEELWLQSAEGRYTELFLQAFPSASVSLYEDGLHFYCGGFFAEKPTSAISRLLAPFLRTTALFLPRSLRLGVLLRLPGRKKQYLRRVRRAYGFLEIDPKGLGGRITAPLLRITGDSVRAVIGKYPLRVAPPPAVSAETVVFLGGAFANAGQIQRATELGIYANAIEILLDRGSRVLWKEHPRNRTPFYSELAAQLRQPERFERFDDDTTPVEIYVARGDVQTVVTITSASLFYCSALFGTPVFTCAAEISQIDDADTREMVGLCIDRFPSLASFPKSGRI